ncbi:ATP-binding protein [Streptomyces sp. 7N604]|uniref:ATP-binding protein n=1 Tax=Streptomyces sp. 7N604 TaxID=3457415 RepID=UPI003FD0EBD3
MSTATVSGTGTMVADRSDLPASVPGCYLRRHRDCGFVAHITVSKPVLSTVRRLTARVLVACGVGQETAGTAQLIVSELVANAVRACGDHVPLVVEVYRTSTGVAVNVHDPVPELLPRRSEVAMDSDDAESGRGLLLLEALAPGWTVEHSLIGKQIRCHLATE